MMQNFLELEVTSVAQFIRLVEEYGSTADLFYRGQSAKYDSLKTSLERHSKTSAEIERVNVEFDLGLPANENFGWLSNQESKNLLLFQSRARHYLDGLPEFDNYFEWFALMQHHGAPSRLLDVTKSLFVALYFATEHADEHDGIVYSFFSPSYLYDGPQNDDHFPAGLRSILSQSPTLNVGYPSCLSRIANQVIALEPQFGGPGLPLNDQTESVVALVEVGSMRPTKREIAQQGCFLMPTTVQKPFETVVKQFYSHMPASDADVPTRIDDLNIYHHYAHPVIKFRIPRARFRNIRVALKHMNITTESLFPDFEGLAKSINSETIWTKEVYQGF